MSAVERDAINVRRMTRSDIDAMLILASKATKGKIGLTYRDLAANDPGGPLDLSFVAEAKDQILGFIMARLEYVYIPFVEVCLVQAIVADPEYQGRGVGAALINELIGHCHLEGINTIRTLVRQKDKRLQAFIEHLGFHRSNIINWDKTFET